LKKFYSVTMDTNLPPSHESLITKPLKAQSQVLARFCLKELRRCEIQEIGPTNGLFRLAQTWNNEMVKNQRLTFIHKLIEGVETFNKEEKAELARNGIALLRSFASSNPRRCGSQHHASTEMVSGSSPCQLLKNLYALRMEIGWHELPQFERTEYRSELFDCIRDAHMIKPNSIKSLTEDLDFHDRRELGEGLAELNIIPKERAYLVERTFAPDGYYDQLHTVILLFKFLKRWIIFLCLIPIIEIVFVFFMPDDWCEVPLEWYIWLDGYIGFGCGVFSLILYHTLRPALKRLNFDFLRVIYNVGSQWFETRKNKIGREHSEESLVEALLLELIAPAGITGFKSSIKLLGTIVLTMVILAMIWLCFGLFEVLTQLDQYNCGHGVVAFTIFIFALRIVLFLLAMHILSRVRSIYKDTKSQEDPEDDFAMTYSKPQYQPLKQRGGVRDSIEKFVVE